MLYLNQLLIVILGLDCAVLARGFTSFAQDELFKQLRQLYEPSPSSKTSPPASAAAAAAAAVFSGKHVHNAGADLMIGVILPLTEFPDCQVQNLYELQVLEALFHTLDLINKEQETFPFSLGAIVLDSCGNSRIAAFESMRLVTPNLLLRFWNEIYNILQFLHDQCIDNLVKFRENVTAQDRLIIAPIVAIIGSSSSDESAQMAQVVRIAELPQISHGATSFDLSSKVEYPNFLRTVPSDKNGIHAIVGLLLAFNWTYVSAVYDDSMYSLKSFSVLEDAMKQSGLCLAAKEKIEILNNDFNKTYLNLRSSKARVVIILSTSNVTKNFLEFACSKSPDSFVWIGLCSWTGRIEFTLPASCSVLKRTLGVIARTGPLEGFETRFINIRPSDSPSSNRWMAEYFERACKCKYLNGTVQQGIQDCEEIEEQCAQKVFANYKQDPYVSYISKAVQSLAIGLKTLYMEKNCSQPRNFSQPICKDMAIGTLIEEGSRLIKILRDVTFVDSCNSTFYFNNGIDGPPLFTISYYNETDWVEAGECECHESSCHESLHVTDAFFEQHRLPIFLNVTSQCSSQCSQDEVKVYPNPMEPCCWTCVKCADNAIIVPVLPEEYEVYYEDEFECATCTQGMYPNANRTVCLEYTDITISSSEWLWLVLAVTASVGMLLTTGTFIVFWVYRNTPILLASDHRSSYVMLFACSLLFVATFIILARPSPEICTAIRCVLGICGTLLYSSIFGKTLRIMLIFRKPTHIPRMLKSRYAVVYVTSIAFGFELLFLLLWMIADPPHVGVEHNTITHEKELYCDSVGYATAFILFVPILLGVVSVFLAFRIRKVPDGFNESKQVSFVVYANLIILISFMVPLASGALPYKTMMFTLAVLYQLMGLATLTGIFFQKMYVVLLRPEKNTKQAVMTRTRTLSCPDNLLTDRRSSPAIEFQLSQINTGREGTGSVHADAPYTIQLSTRQIQADITAAETDSAFEPSSSSNADAVDLPHGATYLE